MALVVMLVLALGVAGCRERVEEPAEDPWRVYRQRFVTPEGRTVDTGNAGVTHSEAQGYAMLLAAAHDDRETFERLWSWTAENLRARGDRLFAWRWEPGQGVTDPNNASDGDLLIAWALLRAGERWGEPRYRAEALAIARELRAEMTRDSAHGLLLLPGEHGFDKPERLTVNLSYWVFPALVELERADPAPEWRRLIDSGLELLALARFGRWQLPPDWLQVEPELAVAPDFPPRFGYNAVRIPLYLVWAGLGEGARLDPFLDFWDHFDGAGFVPPWTDLGDDSVDSYDALPGMHAVVRLTRAAAGRGDAAEEAGEATPIGEQDYYSASLALLARLAAEEGR